MNESRAIDAVRKQVAALTNVSASIPPALSQYMAGLKAHDVAHYCWLYRGLRVSEGSHAKLVVR